MNLLLAPLRKTEQYKTVRKGDVECQTVLVIGLGGPRGSALRVLHSTRCRSHVYCTCGIPNGVVFSRDIGAPGWKYLAEDQGDHGKHAAVPLQTT